ncbi:hypothetical protein [Candidatus Methanomassiliicoccus intestinalis]|uniref:hypothetical protein n=2 Tax=Candidatus Methanomassiliicoccus intestinalis TaxID=1406512 RepID=UPI0037DCCFE3
MVNMAESKDKMVAVICIAVALMAVAVLLTLSFTAQLVSYANASEQDQVEFSNLPVVVLGYPNEGEEIKAALIEYTSNVTIQEDFESIAPGTIVFITETYTFRQDYNYLINGVKELVRNKVPVVTLFESPYILIMAGEGGYSYSQDANAHGLLLGPREGGYPAMWYSVTSADPEDHIQCSYEWGKESLIRYDRA